jgi:hypothetical protein
MLDASGVLIGQPRPADPVFIKDENGKVLAFPSVAVMLISDQIIGNLVTMLRVAIREDMIDLLMRAELVTPEVAAMLHFNIEPVPNAADQAAQA